MDLRTWRRSICHNVYHHGIWTCKKKILKYLTKRRINKAQALLKSFSDIFTPNQLSYLAVLGQKNYDENAVSRKLQKELPTNIKEYRFLMSPVRLSIMKQLHKNFTLSSVELRDSLDISWGEYANHINALEKRGFITQHDDFLDGKRVSIIYLEELGRMEYESLINLLRIFLDDASDDFFDETPKDDLYPIDPQNSSD